MEWLKRAAERATKAKVRRSARSLSNLNPFHCRPTERFALKY
jgi:hypothetical protein